ncbi:MAG: PEP-CTERM sorting domain-containing protein [Nitrospirae bacterium]|nr:MAG: PEP-CTERM sorting domain-containing protein [Nitrospirota bacterium]
MRIGLLVATLALCPALAHAALVANGQVAFSEPNGGVGSPGFSGTLYAEVFDAGGGTFSATGEAVAATGGDYTVALQVVLDPDADGQQALVDRLTVAAYMLGPGMTGNPGWSFGPPPSGGGTLGGGADPAFSAGGGSMWDPGDAIYTWSSPLAEGSSSAGLYFTHPNLALPDAVVIALETTVATSVNATLPLTAVPEPTALALVAGGLALAALRRR